MITLIDENRLVEELNSRLSNIRAEVGTAFYMYLTEDYFLYAQTYNAPHLKKDDEPVFEFPIGLYKFTSIGSFTQVDLKEQAFLNKYYEINFLEINTSERFIEVLERLIVEHRRILYLGRNQWKEFLQKYGPTNSPDRM